MKEKYFNEGKLTQIGRLTVIVIIVPLCSDRDEFV
jgi:hypothetical protein